MRIHDAMEALKSIEGSAQRSGNLDDSEGRVKMQKKMSELEEEIQMRIGNIWLLKLKQFFNTRSKLIIYYLCNY